jgi:hypothetical protein
LEAGRTGRDIEDTEMAKLVTSDQFVAGIVAMLALKERTRFWVTDTELDKRFEKAFEDLIKAEETYEIHPNFSFYVDPYHGDSVCLRDTLTAAKEKELVSFNNPTFRTFDVKLTAEHAERYLKRSPVPRELLERMVDTHFPA